MPRYFFHLRDDDQVYVDGEGMDLPDLHAALEEVFRAARELGLDPPGRDSQAFLVADSTGRTLLVVPIQGIRHAYPFLTGRDAEQEQHPGITNGAPLESKTRDRNQCG